MSDLSQSFMLSVKLLRISECRLHCTAMQNAIVYHFQVIVKGINTCYFAFHYWRHLKCWPTLSYFVSQSPYIHTIWPTRAAFTELSGLDCHLLSDLMNGNLIRRILQYRYRSQVHTMWGVQNENYSFEKNPRIVFLILEFKVDYLVTLVAAQMKNVYSKLVSSNGEKNFLKIFCSTECKIGNELCINELHHFSICH